MDTKTKTVVEQYIRRMNQAHPEVKVEIKDYKWSTEDVTVEILIPDTVAEDVEDTILDLRTELTGRLFDSTGIYILAVARTVDQPSA